MSAEAALRHPYFRSLGERVHQLEDSECEGEAGGASLDLGVGQRVWGRREQSPEPRARVWLSILAPPAGFSFVMMGANPVVLGLPAPTEGVPPAPRT